MDVRTLKTKDLRTVGKIVHASRVDLMGALKESQTNPGEFDESLMGAGLVLSLFGQSDAFLDWLADMAGMSPREFDDLGFEASFDVIEAIMQQEEWPRFLDRLRGRFGNLISLTT